MQISVFLKDASIGAVDVVRIKLPPWLHRAVKPTDTQVVLAHNPPPSSLSVLLFSSISPPSQIAFQSPLNIKVSKPRPTFFSKDWPGQQAPAQVGTQWHMLAHIGKSVVLTKWLPSHRGLPKQLQMTALSFSGPISLSPPLCLTLLLPLSVSLPLSLFSLSLSLSLPAVFISCTESVNLMKRKVKHLAGIRKHPCDNYVRDSCVRVSAESRFIL